MATTESLRRLKQSVFLNYGVAVLAVIVALFIARLIQFQYEFEPFVLFILAMMFSAWYGGIGPGLLSVALSLLAFHYYFLIPIYPLGIEREIPRLLFAGLTSLLIVLLGAAQRSATEALRESELRLRQIAENIREVFWMATRALDEPLYVSPAYASIWGQSVESLRQQPRSFFDGIHVEDREHAVAIIMGQREQEIDIEYRIVRPDGTLRWIRDRRFPVKDASGNVYRVAGIAEDISERKKAEEALWSSERKLHEREELYRMLTENANDFIRVHKLDGRSIYASPSVLRLYGQEPAHIFQFAHPEDLAKCRLWWERILAKGREPFLWRVRDRDGAWRWMETQGSLVQYHGQPHVMTVCRDVTEWKKAEEAALENARTIQSMSVQKEEHLRLVIDTIPAMVWSLRPDGVVDFLNKRWVDYSGLTLERYVQDPTGPIHPEDIPRVMEKWRAAMAVGEPSEDEMRLRSADGEYRWFLVRTVPLRDEQGNIVKWYGTSTDIEDRKEAEEALRQSEERFAAFMNNLPGYAWMKDLQGRYVYINQMVRGLPGYRSLGKTDAQIWSADLAAEYRANDQQVIAAKKPLHTVEHYLHEGKQRYMVGSKFPIFDKTGAVALVGGVGVDITERIEAEEALRDAASQLEALSRRLVELQESERKELARELHDRIGQSLTALNINLNILATALPPQASDELRRRLADSEALVESTTAAIRNVMSELRPPMLDDQGLVSALDWYAKQFSARTGISVVVRGLESAERPAPEMEIALFRVAQEALNNVVKHARASRVEIILGRSGSEYVMTVEDDGVGFDAAKDSVAQEVGFGMVTMRERTQALGGRLEVRTGRGDGTRLTVRVPA